jgi:serine/threonine-protein kinase
MAVADYTEAIRLDAKNPSTFNNLAWLFGTFPNADFRNGSKAVEHAKQACELTSWKDAEHLDTLGAAYAEAGDFDEAIKWQEKSIDLAGEKANAAMRTRLGLYKEGTPFREELKK